jgi:hypothetical protein
MKVYLSNYRHHWFSPYTLIDYFFFWTKWSKCHRDQSLARALSNSEDESTWTDRPDWVEKWHDRLAPLSVAIQKTLDLIHPKIDYVKVDYWDTWSMDDSLAQIILPLLRQLHDKNHGAPFVDDEDVPDHTYKCDYEGMRAVEARIQNGFRLFGRYYQNLWD